MSTEAPEQLVPDIGKTGLIIWINCSLDTALTK